MKQLMIFLFPVFSYSQSPSIIDLKIEEIRNERKWENRCNIKVKKDPFTPTVIFYETSWTNTNTKNDLYLTTQMILAEINGKDSTIFIKFNLGIKKEVKKHSKIKLLLSDETVLTFTNLEDDNSTALVTIFINEINGAKLLLSKHKLIGIRIETTNSYTDRFIIDDNSTILIDKIKCIGVERFE